MTYIVLKGASGFAFVDECGKDEQDPRFEVVGKYKTSEEATQTAREVNKSCRRWTE